LIIPHTSGEKKILVKMVLFSTVSHRLKYIDQAFNTLKATWDDVKLAVNKENIPHNNVSNTFLMKQMDRIVAGVNNKYIAISKPQVVYSVCPQGLPSKDIDEYLKSEHKRYTRRTNSPIVPYDAINHAFLILNWDEEGKGSHWYGLWINHDLKMMTIYDSLHYKYPTDEYVEEIRRDAFPDYAFNKIPTSFMPQRESAGICGWSQLFFFHMLYSDYICVQAIRKEKEEIAFLNFIRNLLRFNLPFTAVNAAFSVERSYNEKEEEEEEENGEPPDYIIGACEILLYYYMLATISLQT
jgi:hypothetical protein